MVGDMDSEGTTVACATWFVNSQTKASVDTMLFMPLHNCALRPSLLETVISLPPHPSTPLRQSFGESVSTAHARDETCFLLFLRPTVRENSESMCVAQKNDGT